MSKQELQRFLTRTLKLRSPRFELERLPGGKLSGSVISDTFKGKTDLARQKAIWDALDKAYGARSTAEVGTLLAYTTAEWNVDLAGKP